MKGHNRSHKAPMAPANQPARGAGSQASQAGGQAGGLPGRQPGSQPGGQAGGPTVIIEGLAFAASINCLTALGRSATG